MNDWIGRGVRRLVAWAACVAVAVAARPGAAAAQAPTVPPVPKPPPRRWTGTATANGTVLFGNTDQRVFGGRATLARADSVIDLDAGVQILYGDSEVDGERREVTKRLWLASLSLDYKPGGRTSPFVLGTVESNLEKQLAARYSLSAGVKQTFVSTERAEASLSVALLDERTVPRFTAPDVDPTRLTRWSFRARMRRAFDEKLRISHVTFWQPSAGDASRFLVRTTTEAAYALTRVVGLSLSLHDNYDSEAKARGARVNNDGQLLFGISARW